MGRVANLGVRRHLQPRHSTRTLRIGVTTKRSQPMTCGVKRRWGGFVVRGVRGAAWVVNPGLLVHPYVVDHVFLRCVGTKKGKSENSTTDRVVRRYSLTYVCLFVYPFVYVLVFACTCMYSLALDYTQLSMYVSVYRLVYEFL